MVTISYSLLLSRRLCGLKAGAGLIEGVHEIIVLSRDVLNDEENSEDITSSVQRWV